LAVRQASQCGFRPWAGSRPARTRTGMSSGSGTPTHRPQPRRSRPVQQKGQACLLRQRPYAPWRAFGLASRPEPPQGRGNDRAAPPAKRPGRTVRSAGGSAFTPEPGRPPVPGFRSIPRTRATGRSRPGRSSPPMCPVDNHQDRPTDDQAERRRYGTVAAARADVTFCSAPACRLTIRIRSGRLAEGRACWSVPRGSE
jgi:hypothetical protein